MKLPVVSVFRGKLVDRAFFVYDTYLLSLIAVGAGGELADSVDSEEDSSQNWKKCKAVARIIGTCPAQVATVEEYYSSVCPQVCLAVSLACHVSTIKSYI